MVQATHTNQNYLTGRVHKNNLPALWNCFLAHPEIQILHQLKTIPGIFKFFFLDLSLWAWLWGFKEQLQIPALLESNSLTLALWEDSWRGKAYSLWCQCKLIYTLRGTEDCLFRVVFPVAKGFWECCSGMSLLVMCCHLFSIYSR